MKYKFEIWQNGERQAIGISDSAKDVLHEAQHYALAYGQYNAVQVKLFILDKEVDWGEMKSLAFKE